MILNGFKDMKIKERIRQAMPYVQIVPDTLRYQFFSKALLTALLAILKPISMLLIRSTGRVAVSSGDLGILYRTWQGPVLIIVAIGTLFLYVAFDLNTQIIYASRLLENRQIRMREIFKEGLLSIKSFFTLDGIGIVLYIALIAPVIGFGLSISLTRDFYIPTFITSVIRTTPLYNTIYIILVIVFLAIGIANFFTIHGVLISGLKSSKADDNSRAIMKKNWKDYLKNLVRFSLAIFLLNILLVLALALPFGIAFIIFLKNDHALRFLLLFFGLLLSTVLALTNSLLSTFYIIKITRLYYRYMGMEDRFAFDKDRKVRWRFLLVTVLSVILLILTSVFFNRRFDEIFSGDITTGIIAHRGGGNEAPENTVEGIETAISLGVYGSEIDIQRTSDGYYIVNHDGNFARLCSDSRKPEEMTLAEVKKLVISDPNYPNDPQEVATFEEMLEAAKGRIVLFVELKGNTADYRMVDDAVRIIKDYGMVDECVLISLKYDLIDYAETEYPEMNTGYLTFVSFGNTAELNCDYLGLEDEAATDFATDSVHKANKKIMVWTPNEKERQEYFLKSEVDYIITDNVRQANEIIDSYQDRSDFEKIVDLVVRMFQ
ncbi:MAG: glycerophosphoryl diester phosphodiesterase membrane domain-containing protein, partial [Erysipelotrichaceae bacterium]|nr:glycerophosphoryl diester phosphodiesterase membrane domain-containing protein [Erysipelotrichaceae bacterium]